MLLRTYMVEAIATFSDSSVMLWGIELKFVPLSVLAVALFVVFLLRSYITKYRLFTVALVIALNALAQQLTDYYFGHNFYDLQQNWHYLAYALYSYMIYRDLSRRKLPLYKMILITYFSALSLSTFDEFFQKFMSARVFDICDIGKDVYGVYMGIILVYLGGDKPEALLRDYKQIRHKDLRQYYRHPFTLVLMLFVLSLFFVAISSVLTDSEYWYFAVILTIIAFSLFFLIFHLSQFKLARNITLGLLAAAILVQGYFFIKYRDDNIMYNKYGLTIYKGIPIPFFDIMIYQNGFFRPVDKKHYFNLRDQDFFFQKKTDIILIASGAYGKGGRGFSDNRHLFLFNHHLENGTQIIIQKNAEAIQTFNRLKREGKRVLFILHNTC